MLWKNDLLRSRDVRTMSLANFDEKTAYVRHLFKIGWTVDGHSNLAGHDNLKGRDNFKKYVCIPAPFALTLFIDVHMPNVNT